MGNSKMHILRGFLIYFAICITVYGDNTLAFTDFQRGILEEHNNLRAKHQADPLVLNQELCDGAQAEANQRMEEFIKYGKLNSAQNDTDDAVSYNDNTLAYRSFSKRKWTPAKVVEEWVLQGKRHNWEENAFNPLTGHFTQMIWASTEEIGVGSSEGRNSNREFLRIFVVRYSPPGNILDRGTFEDNVLPCLNSTKAASVQNQQAT